MERTIVVGYDGTAAGERALVEASHLARQRDLPLTVVHAVHQQAVGAPVPPSVLVEEPLRRTAEELLAGAADLVRYRHPEVEVRTAVVGGPVPSALARAGRGAALLVVGRRGLDRLESMFSASVSARTVACADCPVLVVRDAEPATRNQVLAAVELDGSAPELLRHAYAEASRRQVPLRAVHVWNKPWIFESESATVAEAHAADLADLEMRLQVLLRMSEADHPEVGAYPEVLRGSPPEAVLADRTRTADLLVVGAPRFADPAEGAGGMRVGRVLRTLLRDAACSVVVVPTGDRGRTAGRLSELGSSMSSGL
jgi:nucleotide-binding universal stress UspA family protein